MSLVRYFVFSFAFCLLVTACDSSTNSTSNPDTSTKGTVVPANVLTEVSTNDSFAQRSLVSSSFVSFKGDFRGSSWEDGEPNAANADIQVNTGSCGCDTGTIWYRWVSARNGKVSLEVKNNVGGAPRWIYIAVYTGNSLDNLSSVVTGTADGALHFYQQAGVEYQIQLSAFNATYFGEFTLHLDALVPNNDAFDNRETLADTGGTLNDLTTRNTTVEKGEPNCDSYWPSQCNQKNSQGSMWYSWTAPASGQLHFTVDIPYGGYTIPPMIAMYTGDSMATLVPIAKFKGRAGYFNVDAGVTYQIQLLSETYPDLLNAYTGEMGFSEYSMSWNVEATN